MASHPIRVAFIGFGEAGMAFASAMAAAGVKSVSAYDRKTYIRADRRAKFDDYTRTGVEGTNSNLAAVARATLVLSLVTAGKALSAARETARGIGNGAFYCDMNSVAPETKRAAAAAIEAAGGRYVDVAVMAPVYPARCAVPLLASGPHAADAVHALSEVGFADARVVGARIGDASAVKMIRSVMIKGIEALTAECVLAAEAARMQDEVIASLDASWPGAGWAARTDYNLERMMMHGVRRAEEMREVVKTLDALRTGSAMARATAERQHAIGRLGLDPRRPLAGKVDALLGRGREG